MGKDQFVSIDETAKAKFRIISEGQKIEERKLRKTCGVEVLLINVVKSVS